jgi:peptide/nickel transport system substrate-binding protein
VRPLRRDEGMTMVSATRAVRYAFFLTALAGAAGLLAADAGARATTARADIKQLTWALPEAIRGLDYTHSADGGSATVISLGMEPLVRYDLIGKLTPALASSFSTPNATTYVYNIRKGVKFWDGKPLTTADVIYSLQRAADKKGGSQIASFFSDVKSMTATGASQVTIKLAKPNPFFKYSIAVTYIGEKAYWSAHLKTLGTPAGLNMGTGPFEFSGFTTGQNVTLTRNDNYWGKEPAAAKVVIDFITDPATLLLAVRSGQVDGTFNIPQQEISQYMKLPSAKVTLAPELRTAYISLDTESAPYNDVHVRRAIAYATDKVGLVKAVLGGYGQTAPAMPPPQQWGGMGSQTQVKAFYKTLPAYTFNLAKAKAELKQSATPNGFTATVPYPDSEPQLGKLLLSLSQNLKQIGVTLNVKQITSSAWFNILFSHPTPMGMQVVSWVPDYPDPADAAALIYNSAFATKNSFNTANYKNPKMDALLATQQKSVSDSVRAKAIEGILRLGATDLPHIPVWYDEIGMALSTKYSYAGFGTWFLYSPWAANITAR